MISTFKKPAHMRVWIPSAFIGNVNELSVHFLKSKNMAVGKAL